MQVPTISFSLFNQAKFKLAFWYAIIILCINTIISSLVYFRTTQLLNQEFTRIQAILEEERKLFGVSYSANVPRQLALENLEQTKQNIFWQLVTINSGITAIILVAGYILAGKTLNPIAHTMEQQEEFVANASHELRTPLTSLQTSLEVNLADPSITDHAKSVLKENLDDVTQLIHLTDRLLKLARPQSHQQKLVASFTHNSLHSIVKQAVKTVQYLVQEKQQSILAPKADLLSTAYWYGDKALLVELLVIVLDNASKYSPPDTTITITLKATHRYTTLTVSDQGVGIAPEHQTQVFDRFYQVKQARSRSQFHGYGLGLSLAKHIVEYHNGSITLKSKPGKGTQISMSLPTIKQSS